MSNRIVSDLRCHLSRITHPAGVTPVPEEIPGTSFFPGGSGLWYSNSICESPKFPFGGIMVLAHNFYPICDYLEILNSGKMGDVHPSNSKIWHGLSSIFCLGINPKECFFTNFFMGLSTNNKKEGKFPGASSAEFVQACKQFLALQISTQKPRSVFVLGIKIAPYLNDVIEMPNCWRKAKSFRDIDGGHGPLAVEASLYANKAVRFSVVALTHPSRRGGNVGRRTYKDKVGDEAESHMIRDALIL